MKYIIINSIIIALLFIACKDKNPVNVEEQDDFDGINIPQTSGFWKQTSGPAAGQIISLSTFNDNYIIAGVQNNGLHISADNGKNWTEFNLQFKNANISALAVSKNGDVYCSVVDKGLFKYDNNKKKWENIENSIFDSGVYSILINSMGNIFIGKIGSVYRSMDNGGNWKKVLDAGGSHWLMRMGMNSKEHIFAENYRSIDNGETWDYLPHFGIYSIAFNSNDEIYIANGSSKIQKSSDNGDTWTELGGSISANQIMAVATNSQDNIIAGTSSPKSIFYTIDDGNTWQEVQKNAGAGIFNKNEFGTIYAGTYYNGIYISNDGSLTWEQRGVPCSKIKALANGENNRVFAVTSNGILFKTDDKGSTWDKVDIGLTNTIDCIFTSNNNEVFAGEWDAIFKSEDNGDSWIRIAAGRGTKFSFCELSNDDIIVGTSEGILRSSDHGISWSPISNFSGYTKAIAATNNGNIYAGTSVGLYKSIDNGNNWNMISTEDINAVSINDSDYIFIGIENKGIYLSKDEGITWSHILMSRIPNKIFITQNNNIYVISVEGINKSIDNGKSWQVLDSGLTNEQIYDMTYDSDGYLYVGSWGRGVFISNDQIINNKFDN